MLIGYVAKGVGPLPHDVTNSCLFWMTSKADLARLVDIVVEIRLYRVYLFVSIRRVSSGPGIWSFQVVGLGTSERERERDYFSY